MKVLNWDTAEAKEILARKQGQLLEVEEKVRSIVEKVRIDGDAALKEYTAQFDGARMEVIAVGEEDWEEAYSKVDEDFLKAIRRAKDNIEKFHLKQKEKSWLEPDAEGSMLGQLILPIQRAGIYVPGGTAAYPSSVLMNAVPAKVAGVEEIVMVTPPAKDGSINPHTLVAAKETGVNEAYKVGGAQAVAALAYGTESIRVVDKITGPGNIFVTTAKKIVYGQVDIDMLAGPSEILIVADESARADYLAADMLSQAEHDRLAASVLVTNSELLAEKVQAELMLQLERLPRREIAAASLEEQGAVIICKSIQECIEAANTYAPEHLEVVVENPFDWLPRIRNAGAIFLGSYAPEPVGDYFAGPNHVLPTGGTARFYSPLNVATFMKKSSIISYSREALLHNAADIIKLARTEGLEAHARAVEVRVDHES